MGTSQRCQRPNDWDSNRAMGSGLTWGGGGCGFAGSVGGAGRVSAVAAGGPGVSDSSMAVVGAWGQLEASAGSIGVRAVDTGGGAVLGYRTAAWQWWELGASWRLQQAASGSGQWTRVAVQDWQTSETAKAGPTGQAWQAAAQRAQETAATGMAEAWGHGPRAKATAAQWGQQAASAMNERRAEPGGHQQ
jgi:hypothetical protein